VKLTPENKAYIDNLTLESLLEHLRFAPVGDPWFQGETGEYWGKVISAKRDANQAAWTAASKSVGWDKR